MKLTEKLISRISKELNLELPADTIVRSIRRQSKNSIYGWKWHLYSPTHIWVMQYGGSYTVAETCKFEGFRLTEYGVDDYWIEPRKLADKGE